MKNATTKILLIAAALLGSASVLAASADPFSGYQHGIAGSTAGPAQAGAATAAMGCGSDPFAGYRQAFNTGGPAQLCGDMAPGAQGPAGPTMASTWRDPFEGYNHGIAGK